MAPGLLRATGHYVFQVWAVLNRGGLSSILGLELSLRPAVIYPHYHTRTAACDGHDT